jgi:hypothetical protein
MNGFSLVVALVGALRQAWLTRSGRSLRLPVAAKAMMMRAGRRPVSGAGHVGRLPVSPL